MKNFKSLFSDNTIPFSFIYNGNTYHGLEMTPDKVQPAGEKNPEVVKKNLSYFLTDAVVVCEAIYYEEFGALEWVLKLEAADKKTGLFEDILVFDMESPCIEHTVVHYNKGSIHDLDDFRPIDHDLARNSLSIKSFKGRSSSFVMPFFNIELMNKNEGWIGAIGWSGQWKADFWRIDETLHVKAGMEKTYFRLDPGEKVRMPGMLLLPWEGAEEDGYNRFRQLMFANFVPEINGKLMEGPVCATGWGATEAAEHIKTIEKLKVCKGKIDFYWIDAGWYGPDEDSGKGELEGVWWHNVGDWVPCKKTYPNGLIEIADRAADSGMKFLLWFEPERAVYGTRPTMEHPEWFLGERKEGCALLLNLGIPEACRYISDTVADILVDNNIKCYRQDFNIDPYYLWLDYDAPERLGLNEAHYIEGLYTFWDNLIERVPDLLIDNCASGGRRLDYETTRRSMPLWRSDYQCFGDCLIEGMQFQSAAVSRWIPLSASRSLNRPLDTYDFRSSMWAGIAGNYHDAFQDQAALGWYNDMIDQYHRFKPFLYGNMYMLTNLSVSFKDWHAFQLYRPDLKEGVVECFRRSESPYETARFYLREIDADCQYEFEDADTGEKEVIDGKSLIENGLSITLDKPYSCRMIFYKVR